MKKILIILCLSIPFLVNGQSFFRPVTEDIFPRGTDRALTSVWLPRPYFDFTALRVNFGEEMTVEPFSSLGTGVSLALFKDVDGKPYQVFAANLVALLGTSTEETPLEFSLAVTVTGWQYLSAGIGYDFMNKNPFLMTSFSFNFNRL